MNDWPTPTIAPRASSRVTNSDSATAAKNASNTARHKALSRERP